MSDKKNRFDKSFRRHWKSQDIRDIPQGVEDRIWERINRIISTQSTNYKVYFLPKLLKYAAVFIGVLFFLIGLYKWSGVGTDIQQHQNVVVIESEDGTVREIKDNQHIDFTIQQIASVSYDATKIVYKPNIDAVIDDVVSYHTLKVPHGKIFELVLSDGSKVLMNAGSSIRYPVKFAKGTVKEVSLSGEAYFEVAKSQVPFIVETPYLKTEVFGTQFNVSAYEDTHQTQVVLVEGSVGVFTQGSRFDENKDLKLHPNEMVSSTNPNKSYDVDVRDYISWKEGEMVFKNETFANIIIKLKRHFGITIITNRKDILKERFTGKFVNDKIEHILNTFKETFPFNYEKIDNKIVIR